MPSIPELLTDSVLISLVVTHGACFLPGSECNDPHYCKYGGTCVSIGESVFCRCLDGFVGNQCELRVNICDQNDYCFNGGTCAVERCSCLDGYSGFRCERVVPRYVVYTRAGCAEHPEFCALRFANGKCDEECNDAKCLFDGFDCVNGSMKKCRKDCAIVYRDGKCDKDCSGNECGFDGGDCSSLLDENETPVVLVVRATPSELCGKLEIISAELAQTLFTPVRLFLKKSDHWVFNAEQSTLSCEAFAHDISENTSALFPLYLHIDSKGCAIRSSSEQSSAYPCFSDPSGAAAFLQSVISPQGFKDDRLKNIQIQSFFAEEVKNTYFSILIRSLCIVAAVVTFVFFGLFGFYGLMKQRRKHKNLSAPVWHVPASLELYGDHSSTLFSKMCGDTMKPPALKREKATWRKNKAKDSQDNRNSYQSTEADALLRNCYTQDAVEPQTCTVSMEPDGFEPDLVRAVRLNSFEMVQLLLSRGDQGSCRDADGNTALHHAVAINSMEIVRLLLESYTCNLNATNALGQTALMLALKLSQVSTECAWYLLNFIIAEHAKKRKAIEKSFDHLRPLVSRAATIAVPSARCFRKRKANTEHYAAFSSQGVLSSQALSKVNGHSVIDVFGRSVLHYAVLNNRVDIIPMLYANGAELNVQDGKGETALHLAARNGFASAVNMLLSLGADPKIVNQMGILPVDLALERGHESVANLIRVLNVQGRSSIGIGKRCATICLPYNQTYSSTSAQQNSSVTGSDKGPVQFDVAAEEPFGANIMSEQRLFESENLFESSLPSPVRVLTPVEQIICPQSRYSSVDFLDDEPTLVSSLLNQQLDPLPLCFSEYNDESIISEQLFQDLETITKELDDDISYNILFD